MSSSVKCLMIGQAGIGKTTFLKKFPNSILVEKNKEESRKLSRETFKINCLNENFKSSKTPPNSEYLDMEVENVDITLETCLIESDLIVNNRVIPSSQIINTSQFGVVILCFAMDDPISFELVKSKYEIDLKKNQSQRHSFILLGLKTDPKSNLMKAAYKKRSCSVNSNSSTSKLQSNKKRTNSESELNAEIPINLYKKFAKQLGSTGSFVQSTNYDDEKSNNDLENETHEFANVTNNNNKTKETIDSYASFVKSVCKFNSIQKQKPAMSKEERSNSGLARSKSFKLKRSFTSPISFLNYQRNKNKNTIELKENETTLTGMNASNNEGQLIEESSNLVMKTSKTDENFTMKKKLSHFFIGIGTYLVTCGSSQSRKLASIKKLNEKPGSSNKSSLLKNKDKSWLLLSSEVSLNSLENDEVFGN